MKVIDHLRAILKFGPKEYLKQIWILRQFRGGKLVGRDEYGNEYFKVKNSESLPYYRKRYVVIADGSSDDSSKIPAEWHGWLHYTYDDIPGKSQKLFKHHWQLPHVGNMTGTSSKYVPYSTVGPKMIPFYPPNMVLKGLAKFTLQNPQLTESIKLLPKQEKKSLL